MTSELLDRIAAAATAEQRPVSDWMRAAAELALTLGSTRPVTRE